MRPIGIDFDNTIVSYDALFHRVACERGIIPASTAPTKIAVRDSLRRDGRESVWTELQGIVYGERMREAVAFPGACRAICRLRNLRGRVVIVSHKTKTPILGGAFDLHGAALRWMEEQGFFTDLGLSPEDVYFEPTKAAKIARIAALNCSHFVDDLPEILSDPAFPASTVAVHFSEKPVAFSETAITKRLPNWISLDAENATLFGLDTPPVLAAEGLTIGGGANNRVTRHLDNQGKSWIKKQYFRNAQDTRNRFATEQMFLRFAAATPAKNRVARAFDWHPQEGWAIFEDLGVGAKPLFDASFRECALRFLIDLNSGNLGAKEWLPPASEHHANHVTPLESVERRFRRFEAMPSQDRNRAETRHFVTHELQSTWLTIRERYLSALSALGIGSLDSEPIEICASPSDFGPHNALVRSDGTLRYFDFEYAGWDDGAKLVTDLFAHPDTIHAAGEMSPFAVSFASELEFPNPLDFAKRCEALLPIFQVKWALIMLNEFADVGAVRRTFALSEEMLHQRRRDQLDRVRSYLTVTV